MPDSSATGVLFPSTAAAGGGGVVFSQLSINDEVAFKSNAHMLLGIVKTVKKSPNAPAELRSIRTPSFDRNRKAHVAVLGVLPSFYGKLKQCGY